MQIIVERACVVGVTKDDTKAPAGHRRIDITQKGAYEALHAQKGNL
jgi:hypothetical protein